MRETGGMRSRWPILALLCVLASLLVPGIASAHTAVGAENRVWAFDLQEQVHVAGQRALTLELHQGYELADYDSASGSLLAPKTAVIPKQTTVIGSRADTLTAKGWSGHNVLDVEMWTAKGNIK